MAHCILCLVIWEWYGIWCSFMMFSSIVNFLLQEKWQRKEMQCYLQQMKGNLSDFTWNYLKFLHCRAVYGIVPIQTYHYLTNDGRTYYCNRSIDRFKTPTYEVSMDLALWHYDNRNVVLFSWMLLSHSLGLLLLVLVWLRCTHLMLQCGSKHSTSGSSRNHHCLNQFMH